MLVPESRLYCPPGNVESTSTPGAARSTLLGPKLEKDASSSRAFVAATVMTQSSGSAPGYCGRTSAFTCALPAAATTSAPAAPAAATASSSGRE